MSVVTMKYGGRLFRHQTLKSMPEFAANPLLTIKALGCLWLEINLVGGFSGMFSHQDHHEDLFYGTPFFSKKKKVELIELV